MKAVCGADGQLESSRKWQRCRKGIRRGDQTSERQPGLTAMAGSKESATDPERAEHAQDHKAMEMVAAPK
jgi:hypothetical protein